MPILVGLEAPLTPTAQLYGRSPMTLLVLGPPLLLSGGLHVSTIHDAVSVQLPAGRGCFADSPRQLFGLLAWSATLLFDTVAFLFTVFKTFDHARKDIHGGIVRVFLRDGVWLRMSASQRMLILSRCDVLWVGREARDRHTV